MAELIDPSDPHDPIARQFVPDAAELDAQPQELADPIGDHAHSPVDGVVHRYPDRALLKLPATCAVYCRFCFRREMVGPGAQPLTPAQLDAALEYIAAHEEIWEVILTGGDPLVLSPRRLKQVMTQLAAIGHVKVIRVHTRIPTVEPSRITPELVKALRVSGKATYVVLHANHPRELTPAAREACALLVDAGIPMLSQSVLLAGVNDDAPTLGALMRALVECRIKPYYLHHARSGARHVASADLDRARPGLMRAVARPVLRAVPAGIRARHSRRARQVADRAELSPRGRPGRYRIEDFNGGLHSIRRSKP